MRLPVQLRCLFMREQVSRACAENTADGRPVSIRSNSNRPGEEHWRTPQSVVWLPRQERDGIQASFCSGAVRVMVATVAFGMGLDAAGVRAVVHTTLPRSLEEYVQQVRRHCESLCSMLLLSPVRDSGVQQLEASSHLLLERNEPTAQHGLQIPACGVLTPAAAPQFTEQCSPGRNMHVANRMQSRNA